MDNKSYYDASQGGFGFGGGGGAIWIFLLAFLFMFRGGYGFDGHRDGGHDGGERYTRYDADFREGRQDRYYGAIEATKERYEGMLRAEKCCCETNQNIKDVRCEVKDQGMETRALMIGLAKDETIERQRAEILALSTKLNREETIAGVIAALRGGHHHHYGFVPAPAGYHYQGYGPGFPGPERREHGCPSEFV